jgi:hypothetical protein
MFVVNDWHVSLVDRLEGKSNFKEGGMSGTTVGRCMGLGPWPGQVVQGPLAVLYKAHENNRGVIRESLEET